MRLTIRNSDGTVSQPMNLDWAAALDKLAAYEDTGLEPDEIKEKVGFMSPVCVGCDGKTADGKRTEKCTYDEDFRKCLERSVHLSELAHAEKQGLLVRLPCKVGDTLFVPSQETILSGTVDGIRVGERNVYVFSKHDFENWVFTPVNFGKTVFLTREEAEAALKGGTGDV